MLAYHPSVLRRATCQTRQRRSHLPSCAVGVSRNTFSVLALALVYIYLGLLLKDSQIVLVFLTGRYGTLWLTLLIRIRVTPGLNFG